MAARNRHPLLRAAVAIAIASTLAGCATRYDPNGNRIYVFQFGQDTNRAIDYSNPRLPQLPAQRPNMELWPIPSPYQFRDLSQYSQLAPPAPVPVGAVLVGDNAVCVAAPCEPTAPTALLASRADVRDGGRSLAIR